MRIRIPAEVNCEWQHIPDASPPKAPAQSGKCLTKPGFARRIRHLFLDEHVDGCRPRPTDLDVGQRFVTAAIDLTGMPSAFEPTTAPAAPNFFPSGHCRMWSDFTIIVPVSQLSSCQPRFLPFPHTLYSAVILETRCHHNPHEHTAGRARHCPQKHFAVVTKKPILQRSYTFRDRIMNSRSITNRHYLSRRSERSTLLNPP